MAEQPTTASGPRLSPWRFVVAFGVISLLCDIVYEGARSITGPLLASLGASAAVVGVVTGVGEAAALVLRLGAGPLADRTGRFWGLTIAGYTITVLAVPLLGVAAILWVAAALVIAERVGKAIRSPAKDALLAHATATVGRGRGFAVHEALDQIGAITGPLLVAAVLTATGSLRPALLSLAVPGAIALGMLLWLRARVPRPADYEPTVHTRRSDATTSARLPRAFWVYAGFTALTMSGFATFGLLAYHLAVRDLVPVATIPIIYAAVMGVDALAALATGYLYDRIGPKTLTALPVLAALVPIFAFTGTAATAITGALLWGAAMGVQESTLRATVADLVPTTRRATAYGVFAATYGGAAAVGATLVGVLYSTSATTLVIVIAAIQAAALTLLVAQTRTRAQH